MRRALSQATEELVEQLYMRAGLWNRFVHIEKAEDIIRKILDAGEPEAIPDLLPVLLTGDKRSATASAEAIHGLLRQLKPADFVNFDQLVRQGYSNWHERRAAWYTIKANDVGRIANMGEESVSILGIASFHGSGYVREEATRQLGKIETGAELPFLLIRANDWVEAVRSLARSLVMARIRSDNLIHFLKWLPLALRLGGAKRNDHSTILQAIRELFGTPEARYALEEGFESKDKFIRRFCFDVALNSGVAGVESTIKQAFAMQDLEVRKAAVSKLGAILPNNKWNDLLVVARRDASASVRREALNIYLEKFGEQAEQEFRSALLEANISIREMAQQFFAKEGHVDVRGYYAQSLNAISGRKLSAAIAGLGETGGASDARLVQPFFANSSARVRAAALHAVGKLNPDAYIETFVFALEDASAGVAREGALALIKKANLVGGLRLWEIYVRSLYPHNKRFVLYLISRISKWDSIIYLIQSLSETDERLVELSKRYVARWFSRYNRSFAVPSADQLKRLRELLRERNLLVSSGTERALESLMKSFS
jgi:HEAT repeat protein